MPRGYAKARFVFGGRFYLFGPKGNEYWGFTDMKTGMSHCNVEPLPPMCGPGEEPYWGTEGRPLMPPEPLTPEEIKVGMLEFMQRIVDGETGEQVPPQPPEEAPPGAPPQPPPHR